jgi:hypothetical protein
MKRTYLLDGYLKFYKDFYNFKDELTEMMQV